MYEENRYFLLSVSIADWQTYHHDFMGHRSGNHQPPFPKFTLPKTVSEAKGALVLLDWKEKKVCSRLELPMPQGFCLMGTELIVTLRGTHELLFLNTEGKSHFSRPNLSNLHTIHPSQRGVLVTSSGTDTIFELDAQKEIVWSWSGFEHGFDTLKDGTPYRFNVDMDHREYVSIAADHPAHINSAIELDKNTVLATCFHQGILIQIDKRSGEWRILLDGLRYPHAIQKRKNGFMVCDSLAGRILLLDNSFHIVSIYNEGLQWVQEAKELPTDHIIALSNRNIAQKDVNDTNKIVIFDPDTRTCDQLDWDIQEHLFDIAPLSEVQAQYCMELLE